MYLKIVSTQLLFLCLFGGQLYAQGIDIPGFIQTSIRQVEQEPQLAVQIERNIASVLKEKKDFDLLKNTVLRSMQKFPNNRGLPDLLAWQFIQQKDFESAYVQYVALDHLDEDHGMKMMEFASICLSNEAFNIALKSFSYVAAKGRASPYYQEARIFLLQAGLAKLEKGSYSSQDLEAQEKNFNAFLVAFGKNERTVAVMYEFARFYAEYVHKPAQAIGMLKESIELPSVNLVTQARCKLELGNIYLAQGEIWEAALLYGQVDRAFKDEALGQEAKLREAKIYYYTGNFILAKSQLDVLKTATSELVSNDALELSLLIQENTVGDSSAKALKIYARADLLIIQNKLDAAQKTLDSIPKLFPSHALNDDILMAGYRIDIKRHQYKQAATKLEKIIALYPQDIWGDDALYHLAEINEIYFKNLSKARELYEQVILKYPGSFFVTDARQRFRILRGDKTESDH